jgi:hypothetical protein
MEPRTNALLAGIIGAVQKKKLEEIVLGLIDAPLGQMDLRTRQYLEIAQQNDWEDIAWLLKEHLVELKLAEMDAIKVKQETGRDQAEMRLEDYLISDCHLAMIDPALRFIDHQVAIAGGLRVDVYARDSVRNDNVKIELKSHLNTESADKQIDQLRRYLNDKPGERVYFVAHKINGKVFTTFADEIRSGRMRFFKYDGTQPDLRITEVTEEAVRNDKSLVEIQKAYKSKKVKSADPNVVRSSILSNGYAKKTMNGSAPEASETQVVAELTHAVVEVMKPERISAKSDDQVRADAPMSTGPDIDRLEELFRDPERQSSTESLAFAIAARPYSDSDEILKYLGDNLGAHFKNDGAAAKRYDQSHKAADNALKKHSRTLIGGFATLGKLIASGGFLEKGSAVIRSLVASTTEYFENEDYAHIRKVHKDVLAGAKGIMPERWFSFREGAIDRILMQYLKTFDDCAHALDDMDHDIARQYVREHKEISDCVLDMGDYTIDEPILLQFMLHDHHYYWHAARRIVSKSVDHSSTGGKDGFSMMYNYLLGDITKYREPPSVIAGKDTTRHLMKAANRSVVGDVEKLMDPPTYTAMNLNGIISHINPLSAARSKSVYETLIKQIVEINKDCKLNNQLHVALSSRMAVPCGMDRFSENIDMIKDTLDDLVNHQKTVVKKGPVRKAMLLNERHLPDVCHNITPSLKYLEALESPEQHVISGFLRMRLHRAKVIAECNKELAYTYFFSLSPTSAGLVLMNCVRDNQSLWPERAMLRRYVDLDDEMFLGALAHIRTADGRSVHDCIEDIVENPSPAATQSNAAPVVTATVVTPGSVEPLYSLDQVLIARLKGDTTESMKQRVRYFAEQVEGLGKPAQEIGDILLKSEFSHNMKRKETRLSELGLYSFFDDIFVTLKNGAALTSKQVDRIYSSIMQDGPDARKEDDVPSANGKVIVVRADAMRIIEHLENPHSYKLLMDDCLKSSATFGEAEIVWLRSKHERYLFSLSDSRWSNAVTELSDYLLKVNSFLGGVRRAAASNGAGFKNAAAAAASAASGIIERVADFKGGNSFQEIIEELSRGVDIASGKNHYVDPRSVDGRFYANTKNALFSPSMEAHAVLVDAQVRRLQALYEGLPAAARAYASGLVVPSLDQENFLLMIDPKTQGGHMFKDNENYGSVLGALNKGSQKRESDTIIAPESISLMEAMAKK